jgi:succinoglycan biosynthesis transport protein ExoP
MSEFREIDGVPDSPGAGMNVTDIYYLVFRHKWKIVAFALAGICGAMAVAKLMPPSYESEAKLLIHYVVETKSPTVRGTGNDAQIMSPDVRGETVIATEMEILRSFDLARQVATNVGTARIVGQGPATNDVDVAAEMILKSLMVEAPGKGKVIRIVYHHSDKTVVRPVMRELIRSYEAKHVAIHQSAGILDQAFVSTLKQLQAKLEQTEKDLTKVRNLARIVSVDETKKGYSQEITQIRQELLTVEAEIAQRKEVVKQAEKAMPKSDAAAAELGAPPEKISQYRRLSQQLDYLLNQERGFVDKNWTDEHPTVTATRAQISVCEKMKQEMEDQFPKLATLLVVNNNGTNGQRVDIGTEMSRISGLTAKMLVLQQQLNKIQGDVSSFTEAEYLIKRLEREREAQETMYKEYSASIEAAKLSEASGAGKITNISQIQSPTPPAKGTSKLLKKVAAVLAAGFGGGIGLAFLLEFFLDQSIRRPKDLRQGVGVPLFVTIPEVHRGKRIGRGSEIVVGADERVGEGVKPYCDALRDRLLTHFEVKQLTRKPKLVAVTSSSKGAGVTSLATGLAASLSETGDGNVLLVDMNPDQGVVHPFHRGKPTCALPDVLELSKREAALVQQNLYMATGRDASNKLQSLPKKFTDLFPKFKASDYDYIIFDMPVMNQLSITPRLARFMDMVVMVVESERTNRQAVKDANAYLLESEADMVTVLNKHKPHIPKWLAEES